ncbi:MAG: hypothetical protein L0I76_05245 [Pseudonocardia sp.]|nr:hypothetical protein [Pseudonocardia sp.]
METHGSNSKTSPEEAAASLAAVADSRRKARRADYPAWFWVATGVLMMGAVVYIMVPLPQPVKSLLPLAVLFAALAMGWVFTRVRRLRGPRASTTLWWELWPFVPAIAVMVIAIILHAVGVWVDPIGGLITAGVVFVAWVATGLAISARPVLR